MSSSIPQVFQEVQKLKKQKRALKAKAALKQDDHQNEEAHSKAYAEALEEN